MLFTLKLLRGQGRTLEASNSIRKTVIPRLNVKFHVIWKEKHLFVYFVCEYNSFKTLIQGIQLLINLKGGKKLYLPGIYSYKTVKRSVKLICSVE